MKILHSIDLSFRQLQEFAPLERTLTFNHNYRATDSLCKIPSNGLIRQIARIPVRRNFTWRKEHNLMHNRTIRTRLSPYIFSGLKSVPTGDPGPFQNSVLYQYLCEKSPRLWSVCEICCIYVPVPIGVAASWVSFGGTGIGGNAARTGRVNARQETQREIGDFMVSE